MGCLRPWFHMPSLLPNLVPAPSSNLQSFPLHQMADSNHTCLSVHRCLWDCEGRLTPCWGVESWIAPGWRPAAVPCSPTPHFSLSWLDTVTLHCHVPPRHDQCYCTNFAWYRATTSLVAVFQRKGRPNPVPLCPKMPLDQPKGHRADAISHYPLLTADTREDTELRSPPGHPKLGLQRWHRLPPEVT